MSNLSIEYLKEHKCADCYNFCARGYILCPGHLWGFPNRMDDEDIKRLKELEAGKKMTRRYKCKLCGSSTACPDKVCIHCGYMVRQNYEIEKYRSYEG